jgi:hypothetical protein
VGVLETDIGEGGGEAVKVAGGREGEAVGAGISGSQPTKRRVKIKSQIAFMISSVRMILVYAYLSPFSTIIFP